MRISDWSSDVCSSDLLEEKGRNSEEVWTSITVSQGSVQHLDFLNDDEKDVFKTAFELDQRWLIEHAGDRAPFICQAQSLNVFVQIGRASCRDRVCQYVSISVVAVSLKKKKLIYTRLH